MLWAKAIGQPSQPLSCLTSGRLSKKFMGLVYKESESSIDASVFVCLMSEVHMIFIFFCVFVHGTLPFAKCLQKWFHSQNYSGAGWQTLPKCSDRRYVGLFWSLWELLSSVLSVWTQLWILSLWCTLSIKLYLSLQVVGQIGPSLLLDQASKTFSREYQILPETKSERKL